MLMYFAERLVELHSGFNVFQYITLRTILGVLTALGVSLLLGYLFIEKLGGRVQQNVREDGPSSHLSKRGTPTMGGILMMGAIVVAVLLWADLYNRYILLCLLALVGFGLIGAFDDALKQYGGDSGGLRARSKFALQVLVGFGLASSLYYGAELPQERLIIVPMFKDVALDFGWWFIPVICLYIVGFSNAVNLTDGLDGLAILPTVMIIAALSLFAYASGHVDLAHYLAIPHLPLSGELAVFGGAVVGAGLGFLWFNTYPAQVFMGDIGSLALGAVLGLLAVLVRQEIVLIIMGGVFVMETLSVMTQVASYKLTGRRVFRMAPIHHHFELRGWPEPRVVVRFWIITVILVLVGLATLKIR